MEVNEKVDYLDEERIKLWEELSQIKGQLQEIKELTPDDIQVLLERSVTIKSMTSEVESAHTSIKEATEKSNILLQAAEKNMEASTALFGKFDDLDKKSTAFLQKIEVSAQTTSKILEEATKTSDELDTINEEITLKKQKLEEIRTINDESTELKDKIDLAYENIDKNYKEINSTHLKIFGFTKTDEDGKKIKVQGLKDELDKSYDELDDELSNLKLEIEKSISSSKSTSLEIQKHWESEHGSLKGEIERLLPGALTTGLSYAYKEKKDKEIESMDQAQKTFQKSIIGLIFVSLIPFAISIYLLTNGNNLEYVILKLPRIVMAILPLYIPVLWIAYASSKKINLSKRLIEEYAHKEALSKTYEGLSKQVNSVHDGEEKNELKIKLLYNLLDVSAENPGKLIYDYSHADHPLMDALDKSAKLSDAIAKISNIPGMSKISKIMVEKNKKIQEKLDEKVSEGIESVVAEGK